MRGNLTILLFIPEYLNGTMRIRFIGAVSAPGYTSDELCEQRVLPSSLPLNEPEDCRTRAIVPAALAALKYVSVTMRARLPTSPHSPPRGGVVVLSPSRVKPPQRASTTSSTRRRGYERTDTSPARSCPHRPSSSAIATGPTVTVALLSYMSGVGVTTPMVDSRQWKMERGTRKRIEEKVRGPGWSPIGMGRRCLVVFQAFDDLGRVGCIVRR